MKIAYIVQTLTTKNPHFFVLPPNKAKIATYFDSIIQAAASIDINEFDEVKLITSIDYIHLVYPLDKP